VSDPSLFCDSITHLPQASNLDDATRFLDELQARADQHSEAISQHITSWLAHPHGKQLLAGIGAHSPYISRIMLRNPDILQHIADKGVLNASADAIREIEALPIDTLSEEALMRELRHSKQRIAALLGVAEVTQSAPLLDITEKLALFADSCVRACVEWCIEQGRRQSEIESAAGLIILGMGKLGAYELNYSSDIDLIALYDRELVQYTGKKTVEHFFVRLVQKLIHLLQERTQDGYVFRTDFRLRPDPSSTPLAVSTENAIAYYETVGQNWERAAMIKARQVAGDTQAGEEFIQAIQPFIWRKHLDFATIADINSIKRQMHTSSTAPISLPGHNIKTGRGGIREIEFYVQTQQLVWGGRTSELRTQSTLDSLKALQAEDIISQRHADTLKEAYLYLRRVEHHLQIRSDQQTHSLPNQEENIAALAEFLGYEDVIHFTREMQHQLETVHAIYIESMEDSEPLAVEGNLVFTGVENDPETLTTLSNMGYASPENVSALIMNWHRGHRRATRSKRSRQLLTELVPALLSALADTANPDAAFARFDDFLAKTPVGVQLFSLLSARAELMPLLAHIMGTAPALGNTLSKYPNLLDTVVASRFGEELPDSEHVWQQLHHMLAESEDYEDRLRALRECKSEREFEIGIRMISQTISAENAERALSDLADIILQSTLNVVLDEFSQSYGVVEGSDLAVVGLGKLGGSEMTFGSDIDIMFIYDGDPMACSNGRKTFEARVYYQRLCQRFISALTVLTGEGRLYDVDVRMRPAGNDSPLALHMDAFHKYFEESAWTFEYMALTKARIVASSSKALANHLSDLINTLICKERDGEALAKDIQTMRAKVADEFPTRNAWNIKHVPGGLMDVNFIAQYIALKYAHTHPDVAAPAASQVFEAAAHAGILPQDKADELLAATHLLSDILSYLRLCTEGKFYDDTAPIGLKNLLCAVFNCQDITLLKSTLQSTEAAMQEQFEKLASL